MHSAPKLSCIGENLMALRLIVSQWVPRCLRRPVLALTFVAPLLTTACNVDIPTDAQSLDTSLVIDTSTSSEDDSTGVTSTTRDNTTDDNQTGVTDESDSSDVAVEGSNDEQTDVQDSVDDTTDVTGDTVDDTTDVTADTVDDTTDVTGDAVDDTTDVTENTVDDTTDVTGDTVVNEEPVEQALLSTTLNWIIPTQRENGSALDVSEIDGYEILYKKVGDEINYSLLIDDASVSTYVLEDLAAGEYEFKIASYDTDGVYSDFSSPIYKSLN